MSIYSVLENPTIIPSARNTSGQSAEEIARENAEKEKVDFLNLLLTQLENQNPLDPLDTKDFTAQLTRYSILEQGIETNEKLALTNDYLKTSTTAESFSYIGKDVELETNISAVQDNQAEWSYLVEGSAKDVKLTITDGEGNRITEVDGSIAPGVQNFTFDTTGLNLNEGQELYLSINAVGNQDAKLNTRTTAMVQVDGVWSDQTRNYLTAGEISFRQSDVLKIIDDSNS